MSFVRGLAVGLGLGMVCLGQGATAAKFEVASIKRCAGGGGPDAVSATPGRLTVNCMSMIALINMAYVLYADGTLSLPGGRVVPIEHVPAWIGPERYSIEAKTEGSASSGEMRGPMLRALLEDRFALKIRTEMREVPVYALTVAKGGAKLQAAQEGSCVMMDFDHPPTPSVAGQALPAICGLARITNDTFDVRGVTLAELARSLRLDRELIDRTGIKGRFDIRVPVAPGLAGLLLGPPLPPPPPGVPVAAPAPREPDARSGEPGDFLSAAQAVVEKVGLRLESGRGLARFLVVDGVERPSEN
jgi:uncharacterized protein (TIGR03435 family)